LIDENELKLWIARLETEESSWPNYQKLAALYIIVVFITDILYTVVDPRIRIRGGKR